MRYRFVFPDVGEGLAEGRIIELKRKPGDRVEEGEPIATVETDKVVTEIPSPRGGLIVELGCGEGETVRVGQLLAVIEAEDGAGESCPLPTVVGRLDPAGETTVPPSPEGLPSHEPARARHGAIPATPATRSLAAAAGLDLAGIPPSGPEGRVLRRDVERAVADSGERQLPNRRRLSALRRTLAANLSRSLEIPSAVIHDFAVVDTLVSARTELAASTGSRTGYLAFFIKAAAVALSEFGLLNAWYDPARQEYQTHDRVDIGVAVHTEEGLMAPVIPDAASLTVPRLQVEIDTLARLARDRELTVSRLRGATFTITNFGAFAGTYATPLIVPPQVGILGTGRIHQAPVARDGVVLAAPVLPLSLVFDHRLIDGAYAARFLARFIRLVSAPLAAEQTDERETDERATERVGRN